MLHDYQGKRVLVTGDSGFVGTWLKTWLEELGANVSGLSLPTDIRKAWNAHATVWDAEPEIVFHLAAQALVGESYANPLGTFETNVLGTANILEAARLIPSVRAVVVITSDKCYAPSEAPHTEFSPLGGDDPYSASKACAELVVKAYRESFGMNVATARAGNIIGGGDWAADRLVPDFMRASEAGMPLVLRNPDAVRSWLHVLDACRGYLLLGAAMFEAPGEFASGWNFGPHGGTTAAALVAHLNREWRALGHEPPEIQHEPSFKESSCLRLNSDKALGRLQWWPWLYLREAVKATAEGYSNPDTHGQIKRYMGMAR